MNGMRAYARQRLIESALSADGWLGDLRDDYEIDADGEAIYIDGYSIDLDEIIDLVRG